MKTEDEIKIALDTYRKARRHLNEAVVYLTIADLKDAELVERNEWHIEKIQNRVHDLQKDIEKILDKTEE